MIKVGDRVQYIGDGHEKEPQFYPEVGTFGCVRAKMGKYYIVKWPDGSTSEEDLWAAEAFDLIKDGE